jgi:hypothetical protein
MAKSKKAGPPAAEWDRIEIGDQIKHPKWGVGTVLFRSGNGDVAKAIVVFPEEGHKKLLLRHASLKKVGSTSLKSVEKLKADKGKASAKAAAAKKPAPEKKPGVAGKDIAPSEAAAPEDATEVVSFDDQKDVKEIGKKAEPKKINEP